MMEEKSIKMRHLQSILNVFQHLTFRGGRKPLAVIKCQFQIPVSLLSLGAAWRLSVDTKKLFSTFRPNVATLTNVTRNYSKT